MKCEDCEHRWWHRPGATWRDAFCLWCGALYVMWIEAVEAVETGAGTPEQPLGGTGR